MWLLALIDGVIGAVLLAIWYLSCRLWLRRRSRRIVRWIELACSRQGRILRVEWLSPSRFRLHLRLQSAAFRNANIVVQLAPREMPFTWLWYRIRRHQETATFAACLDYAPPFDLDLWNHRWCSCHSARRQGAEDGREWSIERLGTSIITSRRDWQYEVVNLVDPLAASREYDFLKIAFRREAPHFSATLALKSIESDALADENVFDVIQELATSSSPSAI